MCQAKFRPGFIYWPILALYTGQNTALYYTDDDARILRDLSLLKEFAQTFVEYEFLPVVM